MFPHNILDLIPDPVDCPSTQPPPWQDITATSDLELDPMSSAFDSIRPSGSGDCSSLGYYCAQVITPEPNRLNAGRWLSESVPFI